MTAEQLDQLYTQACYGMSDAGAAKTELFLSRLVLLLMHEIDEPERILAAIAQAREGL